ncbi:MULTISPECIES: YbaL family putative K(+) efflux transporter [Caulobacter]|uniref:Kef-type potassium/proton antiporter, CPA2 family n=1 Tax=Caulobacter vibrioides OR37 TaxID=1292034 RepID=R0END9_CAUVI|nr:MULTISPECIES: YbaL family putative K(+) efflux transporter [Caulobacter]ENZ83394.1 Kef-type potassium/proton antiporter, CPA2 family [Caulobacter vibrioides OR37]MBQ1562735.1 Kef family K(+) transporter [Caulobacter sp.]
MHHTSLIATIVAGLGLAFVFGAIANRLKLPVLVGYLLAGVLVGPFTPGYVADQELAPQLAEIGVILLMFGVGLHFSLKDLMAVKTIAIPGALAQIAAATVMGLGLSVALGWSIGAGVVFGLALSVASTVVLLRALQERRLIETSRGKIAVGWLIVEDLVMVLALVLLPALSGVMGGVAPESGGGGVLTAFALTIGKVAAFVALMLIVGRRVIPWVLHRIAHTGSRELFRLSVLAIALGVAFGSATLFGVSFALGAFFAGMIMAESELSQQAANETLPLRDAFAVLFFVSIGMLFDPTVLLREPLAVLAALAIIVVGKSLAALIIVLAFRRPMSTALTISVSLAQIGEFSFILAGLGVSLKLLPAQGRDLILAGAILSILVNPLLFVMLDRLLPKLMAKEGSGEAAIAAAARPHAVLVGYGRVGKRVAEGLKAVTPLVVIEDDAERAEDLRAAGFETVGGNAVRPEVLLKAGLSKATHLFIAVPNPFEAARIIEQARAANPRARIVARAYTDADVALLKAVGATEALIGEDEIARGMLARAPRKTKPAPQHH